MSFLRSLISTNKLNLIVPQSIICRITEEKIICKARIPDHTLKKFIVKICFHLCVSISLSFLFPLTKKNIKRASRTSWFSLSHGYWMANLLVEQLKSPTARKLYEREICRRTARYEVTLTVIAERRGSWPFVSLTIIIFHVFLWNSTINLENGLVATRGCCIRD